MQFYRQYYTALLALIMFGLLGCAQQSTAKEKITDLVTFQGEFRQGALVKGSAPIGTSILLNGKPVRVSPSGDFVLGFAREAEPQQTLVLTFPHGGTEVRQLQIKKKHYRIQNVKGIAKKIMQPKADDLARAKKDAAEVWHARQLNSNLTAFASTFIWPLTGRISGVYGSQRIYNDVPGRPHYGVDVAAPTGTGVVAPANGVISLAVPDMFYSGGTVIIDHGYGVSSSFLHLSKLLVKKGDLVKQGQKVAEVGSTGRSTGPHLDWRINWYQMKLDPTSIVPSMKSVLAAKN